MFSRPEFVEIVLMLGLWRFLPHMPGDRLFAYVLLDNHPHWIALADVSLEQTGRFKSSME